MSSSEQTLQELVYAVSHDLGASVRTVRGFADLLSRRYPETLDPEGQNFLRLLKKGADDLQAQLDGLLAYSRVATRGQPFQPVDVNDVWQAVLAANSARIQNFGAIIETSELPLVMADAAQLKQLLTELLDNALKFRHVEPPHLKLTGERAASPDGSSSDFWLLRLSDNGRGIDSSALKRVFGMFQRLCPEVTGSGVGLAVCRRIVERHGGRMWVTSTPNVGSEFCFTLPSANGASSCEIHKDK